MPGRLHKTQDLLYDSTKDYLRQRYEQRGAERHWMGERDHMLRELDLCRQQLDVSATEGALDATADTATETRHASREQLQVSGGPRHSSAVGQDTGEWWAKIQVSGGPRYR